jgi:hypothetical protein
MISNFSKKRQSSSSVQMDSPFSSVCLDIFGSLLIGIKAKFDSYAVGESISIENCCSKFIFYDLWQMIIILFDQGCY